MSEHHPTPNESLIAAARACDPSAIRIALAEGADPDAKTTPHSRPSLHYVVDGDYASMANETTPSASDRILCARLLLDAGADPNACHRELPTLHASVDTPECARLLLERGANPLAKAGKGLSALMHACFEQSHPDSFRLIAAAGGDLRATDENGLGLNEHAVRSGNTAVLSILEELGAGVDFCDASSSAKLVRLADDIGNPATLAWLASRRERFLLREQTREASDEPHAAPTHRL
jgi:ankyrin repeat protein